MLKGRKLITLLLMAVFILGVSAAPAMGWETMQVKEKGAGNKTVTVKAGDVINDDLFLAGDRVRIEGTINGDVVVFANSVEVTGTINGDLLVGCSNLLMSGTVNDDLRIGAQNARITGHVKRNLSAGASQFVIDKGSVIGGNTSVGAEDTNIDGAIQGKLQAATGSLNLTGNIAKDVSVSTDDLNVLPGAVIGGSLKYRGANQGNISPQAQITGPVTYKHVVEQHKTNNTPEKESWAGRLFGLLLSFVSLLLIWFVWFYLHPRSFINVQDTLQHKPWASLGWGFALLILLPIAAVIAMITVVGIPLGLGALILYSAILFAAEIIVGYSLVYYLAVRYVRGCA